MSKESLFRAKDLSSSKRLRNEYSWTVQLQRRTLGAASMSVAKKEEVWPAARSIQPSFAPTSSRIQTAGNCDLLLGESLPSLLLHVGGSRLDYLLDLLHSALKKEIGEKSASKEFTRKCKVHICVGVNNVTRTLERMPCAWTSSIIKGEGENKVQGEAGISSSPKKGKTISLQAILVAADVHPRLLASHLPGLAASRKVPCITVSGGNGTASLRLGEIVNLRTAISIGIKVGNSGVNKAIECFLKDECGRELGMT